MPTYILYSSFNNRYGSYTLSLLIPISAISLNFYTEKISKTFSIKKRNIIFIIFAILIFYFIYSNFSLFYDFKFSKPEFFSNEEREISNLINNSTTDSFVIISKYRYSEIKFLTMRNVELLESLIQGYKPFLDELKTHEEVMEIVARTIDGMSLNQDESMRKTIISKKIELIKQILPLLKEDYKNGRNPLNIPFEKTIYFIEYPLCNGYESLDMCSFITDTFNATLLYSSNGYYLYRIEITS
jgi:hypothetical protein